MLSQCWSIRCLLLASLASTAACFVHHSLVSSLRAPISRVFPLYASDVSGSKQVLDKPFFKPGVLLMNLGGPQKSEDVEEFLFNLFADPDIIRIPRCLNVIQKPLAKIISSNRAPKSIEAYRSIGGGSPILEYTTKQARLLEEQLVQRHGEGWKDVKCYIAMRYFTPYTEQALLEIDRDGITDLVILPLYPHYSISTTGSSLKKLRELIPARSMRWGRRPGTTGVAAAAGVAMRQTVVPAWYFRPGYVQVLARQLLHEVAALSMRMSLEKQSQSAGSVDAINVLFSAHGVPRSYVESAGDPYKRQIEHNALLVAAEARRMMRAAESRGEKDMSWALMHPVSTEATEIAPQHRPGHNSGGESSEEESSPVQSILRSVKSVAGAIRTELLGAPSPKAVAEGTDTEKSSAGDSFGAPLEIEPYPPCDMCPGGVNFHLSYQSRVGPVEWLRPYTDDKIKDMRATNLIISPIAFVSEHIETLEEIDQEYRELAEEHGLRRWGRVPAPNVDSGFIAELSDIVAEAANNAGLRTSRDHTGKVTSGAAEGPYSLERACSVDCSAAYVDKVSGLSEYPR